MAHNAAYPHRTTLQYSLITTIVCSTLYLGQNSRGTNVYTWVSTSDETDFDEDISPLLQYLWRKNLVSADACLGLVEFGSEAFFSEDNVTFSAADFGMQIWKGEPPVFDLNPVKEGCVEPASPSGPQSTGKPKKGSGAGHLRVPSGLTTILVSVTLLLLVGQS